MLLKIKLLLLATCTAMSFCTAQAPFDTLIALRSYDVYFDFGKADIRADADTILRQLVMQLSDTTRTALCIIAHTDAIGNTDANQELSKARADAVRAALIEKGIPDSIFTVAIFGETRPISSNATEKGRQLNRRATVEVVKRMRMIYMQGKVIDPETNRGIAAALVIHAKAFEDTLRTEASGEFKAAIPANSGFGVDIFATGYFFETALYKAEVATFGRLEIPLQPVKVGASVDLKNFYFVGDQDTLLKKSKPELPKLLKFMKFNPLITVEIGGHIHNPGLPVIENSWDYGLSVRRSKMVYDYLIANGIEPIRLIYKGYGNWKMRYPRAKNNQEAEANRRVEIKVVAIRK